MGAAMELTQLKTQNRLRIFWPYAARQVQQALDQMSVLQCKFALEQGLVQRDPLLECLLSCPEVLRGTVLPQNSLRTILVHKLGNETLLVHLQD